MSVDARASARLRQMEDTLKGYRAHISTLEAELERANQYRQHASQVCQEVDWTRVS